MDSEQVAVLVATARAAALREAADDLEMMVGKAIAAHMKWPDADEPMPLPIAKWLRLRAAGELPEALPPEWESAFSAWQRERELDRERVEWSRNAEYKERAAALRAEEALRTEHDLLLAVRTLVLSPPSGSSNAEIVAGLRALLRHPIHQVTEEPQP